MKEVEWYLTEKSSNLNRWFKRSERVRFRRPWDEGSKPYQEEIGFGAARHPQERLLLLRRAALKLLVGE
jgi:hypothetical protein